MNLRETFIEAIRADVVASAPGGVTVSFEPHEPGPYEKGWFANLETALAGPPPSPPAHSHLADLDLLNRLRVAIAQMAPHQRERTNGQLLLDIWEAVKPGDIGEAVSELGILAFAQEQWGVKSLQQIALKGCAEMGELADELIKIDEGRSAIEKADMEAGDTLVVLSQYAAKRNTTLSALRAKAFAKCKDRVIRQAMIEEDATFVPPVSLFDQAVNRLTRETAERVDRMGIRGEEPDPMPKASAAAEELRQELATDACPPIPRCSSGQHPRNSCDCDASKPRLSDFCPKCREFWTDCVCLKKYNPNHES